MKAAGYDTATSISELNNDDVDTIEKFANQKLQNIWKEKSPYSEMEVFAFLPGQRKLLTSLGKHAETYMKSSNNAMDGLNLTQCSTIMKELITTMASNQNCAPRGRRYSEIIQWFSTYIFMQSGRAAYEVLSSNLPIPNVATICKLEF